MNRRSSLKILLGTASIIAAPAILRGTAFAQTPVAATATTPATAPAFTLPPLGYGYEALEPHIDTATMTVHHKSHHQAFINNLNGLVDKYADLKTKPIDQILANLAAVPEAVRTPVRNSLGGHFNHSLYWDLMTPGGAKAPAADLASAINSVFGSQEKMQEAVTQAGMTRFGSGWAWLAVGKDKKLAVFNTPYQDTPHMDLAAVPVLGIDVWEHAYYLKHQSRRADYLKAWWNTVNWDKAAANFKKAVG